MSKQLYEKIVGAGVIAVLVAGYIVSLALTAPKEEAKVDSGLSFEGNLITSDTANKILQRRAVNNLPVNPPDNRTDNPFLALE